MGGGGWENNQRKSQTIRVRHEACTGGHQACEKPTKEEIKEQVKDFNIVLQQVNTYSKPVNQKVLVEIINSTVVVASSVFDVIVIGNQFRIANPDEVSDWIYSEIDVSLTIQTSIYLESTGFGSEVVTAQIRKGSEVVAATSGMIEIDCGPDHPWAAPEQGCVLR